MTEETSNTDIDVVNLDSTKILNWMTYGVNFVAVELTLHDHEETDGPVYVASLVQFLDDGSGDEEDRVIIVETNIMDRDARACALKLAERIAPVFDVIGRVVVTDCEDGEIVEEFDISDFKQLIALNTDTATKQ